MPLVAGVCPACGAHIEIPNEREISFCTYCGISVKNEVAVHRYELAGKVHIEGISNIDEELKRAATFEKLGNRDKAREIYLHLTEKYPYDYRGWQRLLVLNDMLTRRLFDDSCSRAALSDWVKEDANYNNAYIVATSLDERHILENIYSCFLRTVLLNQLKHRIVLMSLTYRNKMIEFFERRQYMQNAVITVKVHWLEYKLNFSTTNAIYAKDGRLFFVCGDLYAEIKNIDSEAYMYCDFALMREHIKRQGKLPNLYNRKLNIRRIGRIITINNDVIVIEIDPSVRAMAYADIICLPYTKVVTVAEEKFWIPRAITTKGCYIATSVYGSYDNPQLWTLRRFRDEALEKSSIGRIFIKIYYKASQALIQGRFNTRWLSFVCKIILNFFVSTLNLCGIANTPYHDD